MVDINSLSIPGDPKWVHRCANSYQAKVCVTYSQIQIESCWCIWKAWYTNTLLPWATLFLVQIASPIPSFPAFNRMYIRFISLEMFITDKGGLDTSHISFHQSLKQSPFFKSFAKEEIGDFHCNGLKIVAARNLQMLITRDSFCTLEDYYHQLSRCTIQWWWHFIVITILVLTINIIITNLLRRISPCLIHCWYWAFLLSGRLVITMPPTCRINNSFRLGNVRYNKWPGY